MPANGCSLNFRDFILQSLVLQLNGGRGFRHAAAGISLLNEAFQLIDCIQQNAHIQVSIDCFGYISYGMTFKL